MKPRNYDLTYLAQLHKLLEKIKLYSYDLIPTSDQQLNILDVGCGNGNDCRNISQLHNHYKVSGLDVDQQFIDQAISLTPKDVFPNVGFVQGNAAKMPFNDDSIDLVRFERVFQHQISPYELMNEAMRVVNKKKGLITIIETDWISASFGTKFHLEERHIMAEKVENDLNNGLSSRMIPNYLNHELFSISNVTNHITSVDSFEMADYIMGIVRNIDRLKQKNETDYHHFLEEIHTLEKLGSFNFCWTTKIFEICPKNV